MSTSRHHDDSQVPSVTRRRLLQVGGLGMFGLELRDVLAGEQVSPVKVEPILAPDKELLAKIEKLPDNTWLKLPAAKTAGDRSWMKGRFADFLGGPMIRNYCVKMVWAPERLRALYCGAGHNVHPWNDVWEYDLASNTWVCLYAPDPGSSPPKANDKEVLEWYQKNFVYRNGFITTRRGAPVRPAHTWWGLCYDSDRRRLVFWDAHKGLLFTNRALLAQALGLQADDRALKGSGSGAGEACVFTFSPEDAAWKEVFAGAPKAYEASNLEYLPDRKKFWLHSGQTYLCDPALSEWKPTVKAGPPGGDGASAYDPESRSIVEARGRNAWVYSCDQNSWTEKAALPDGDLAFSPAAVFFYDSAARRFILITKVAVKDKILPPARLLLYDPKADHWSRPASQAEMPPKNAWAGYYDPARNVTVYCDGRDGVWVYRCQKDRSS